MKFIIAGRTTVDGPSQVDIDSLDDFVKFAQQLNCRFEIIPPNTDTREINNNSVNYMIFVHNDYD